jgi:hypothetical protein
MERIFNKARSHKSAEDWDITQQIRMTSTQRQKAAKALKSRFFGDHVADIRSKRAYRIRNSSKK